MIFPIVCPYYGSKRIKGFIVVASNRVQIVGPDFFRKADPHGLPGMIGGADNFETMGFRIVVERIGVAFMGHSSNWTQTLINTS